MHSRFGRRIGWNILGTAAGRLIGPLAQIAIARFLDPAQFGLFAIGVAWIALFEILKDLGLNHAIIVEEDRRCFVSLQFFVELSIATVLFVITLGCAPVLAAFLHEPKMGSILVLMSLQMFFLAISGPLVTEHMRTQNYRVLAIRQAVIPATMGISGWFL